MNDLITKLKNKRVHIVFFGAYFSGGGVAAANYTVMDEADGFIQLLDGQGRMQFCKLDQVKQIIVEKEETQEGITV